MDALLVRSSSQREKPNRSSSHDLSDSIKIQLYYTRKKEKNCDVGTRLGSGIKYQLSAQNIEEVLG